MSNATKAIITTVLVTVIISFALLLSTLGCNSSGESATTLYVAVGEGGLILLSSDGDAWTQASSSGSITTSRLTGVSYGNGLWVAVGENTSTIINSSDGDTWTLATSSGDVTTEPLQDVAWGGSFFVAVGEGATVIHSNDGDTWTTATNVMSALDLQSVAYDGTSWWVTVGDGGELQHA